MPWLGTVGTDNTIVMGTRYVSEQVTYTFNGTVVATSERQNVIVTTKYVGLTHDAASAYAGSHCSDADVIDMQVERQNEADGYCVIEQTQILGTW